jgi:Dickkopf N-terminal cysteine-rich region
MLRSRAWIVVALAMIAAAACAARPIAPATGAPRPFDLAAFCSDYFPNELRDRKIERCAPEDREMISLMPAVYARLVGICRTAIGRGLASGRLQIDPARVAGCLAAHRSGEHNMPRIAPHCRDVAVGTQDVGASCAGSIECRLGLTCIHGRCQAPSGAGGACLLGDTGADLIDFNLGGHPDCAAGTHCALLRGTICIPDAPDGAPCVLEECAPTSTCINKRCAPDRPLAVGEACLADIHCQPGGYCRFVMHDPNVVPVCAARKPNGRPCERPSECLGTCRAGRCASLCGSDEPR